jgi:hypothetical protein
MDDVGGRREGPTSRPTRGENQCCNAGAEVVTKGHEYYRTIEIHTGYEDLADRIEDYADQQVGNVL